MKNFYPNLKTTFSFLVYEKTTLKHDLFYIERSIPNAKIILDIDFILQENLIKLYQSIYDSFKDKYEFYFYSTCRTDHLEGPDLYEIILRN